MNASKKVALALRKQRLQHRITGQRVLLGQNFRPLSRVGQRVDGVVEGLRWTRKHIPLISTLALSLLVFRPFFVLRFAQKAWVGWQVVKRLRGGLALLSAISSKKH